MDVLITGAAGRCGTAVIDNLHDAEAYDFTYLDREKPPDDFPAPDDDFVQVDIAEYDTLAEVVAGHDAVIHLASLDHDTEWQALKPPNIDGVRNVFEAAATHDVDTVVYASSLHAVGGYDDEEKPAVYDSDHPLTLTEDTPLYPDTLYGVTKALGENLGQYYTAYHDSPRHVYSLRIGSMNERELDHPYAAAERSRRRGEYDRGEPEYERRVARSKCHWISRRDFAHLVECCLQDESVEYDVFYGVSDNEARWVDIDYARNRLGYNPRDSADSWTEPPRE